MWHFSSLNLFLDLAQVRLRIHSIVYILFRPITFAVNLLFESRDMTLIPFKMFLIIVLYKIIIMYGYFFIFFTIVIEMTKHTTCTNDYLINVLKLQILIKKTVTCIISLEFCSWNNCYSLEFSIMSM